MNGLKKILLLLSMAVMLILSSLSPVLAASSSSTAFAPGCILAHGKGATVPLFIQNNDAVEHSYALNIEGMANHYDWYFSSGGASARSVTVPSRANIQIDLNISLKGNPSVNADTLMVKASREDGNVNTFPIAVMINKDYVLTMNSMLGKIDIMNGKAMTLSFSIKNNGSKELTSIKLEPELPNKWIASPGSGTGINLKPGETGTLQMTIEVSASQAAGNFTAKFTAVSNEIRSEQISIPATVSSSSNMAYWMAGALLLIIAFTLVQFRKHGRR
jgi:uncharacterized membrane protein